MPNQSAEKQEASVSVNGTNSNLLLNGQSSSSGVSYGGASGNASVNGCANISDNLVNGCANPSLSNGKTTCGASGGAEFANRHSRPELGRQSSVPFLSVPSSSRQIPESLGRWRASSLPTFPLKVQVQVPDIPDSVSDSESVYSYQGYETGKNFSAVFFLFLFSFF